jgi:hypothetical protein
VGDYPLEAPSRHLPLKISTDAELPLRNPLPPTNPREVHLAQITPLSPSCRTLGDVAISLNWSRPASLKAWHPLFGS